MQKVWRASSYSGHDGNCLQMPGTLDALRDSKNPTVEMNLNTAIVKNVVQYARGLAATR